MGREVPLSTLLGQLVVAFTIEVDDLFEQRMPHSATVKHGAGLRGGGPWLVSYVMSSNFLRHIEPVGTPVAELQRRAASSQRSLKSRLNHLTWWAYVTVDPPKSTRKPKYADHVVSLTAGGQKACRVFEPLPALVEQRWTERFGERSIRQLREALLPFIDDAHPDLPRYLPVVEYGDGMRSEVVLQDALSGERASRGDRDLLTLLAQALLLFTLDFESDHPVLPLPLLADVVRLLDREATPLKEVTRRAGVSKEGVSAAMTFLGKSGLVDTVGSGATAEVLLTPEGTTAGTTGNRRLRTVEQAWSKRRTGDVAALREAADAVLSQGVGPGSAMANGLRPHAGGWRTYKQYLPRTEALLADPRGALPHHPMVLHRGGFPDGS